MSKCNWVSCIYKSLLLDVSWKELKRQGADIDQLLTYKEDIVLFPSLSGGKERSNEAEV